MKYLVLYLVLILSMILWSPLVASEGEVYRLRFAPIDLPPNGGQVTIRVLCDNTAFPLGGPPTGERGVRAFSFAVRVPAPLQVVEARCSPRGGRVCGISVGSADGDHCSSC